MINIINVHMNYVKDLIGEDFFTNFYYTNANGTKKWYDKCVF